MKYKIPLLIIALYALIQIPNPVLAFPAISPDPEEAYRIHIQLDKRDLPPGVRLIEKPAAVRSDASYGLSTACIYGFVNETDKPFYILDPAGNSDEELSNVPKDYRPLVKFISGSTYLYSESSPQERKILYNDSPHPYSHDKETLKGWNLLGPSTEILQSFDLIDLRRMGNPNINAWSWGCSFAALNSREYTDKHEDALWLNSKHSITITAYYEDELRLIHGKIWFTRYDPRSLTQRVMDGAASYISFTEAHPFKAQAWILIFVGATYLVARWLSRRYQLD